MGKAMIIEFETLDDLADQIRAIAEGIRLDKEKEIIPSNNGEVPGKVFQRMMAEKGYKVNSFRSKMMRVKMFKITATKRGREWWFKKADVDKVPTRR